MNVGQMMDDVEVFVVAAWSRRWEESSESGHWLGLTPLPVTMSLEQMSHNSEVYLGSTCWAARPRFLSS